MIDTLTIAKNQPIFCTCYIAVHKETGQVHKETDRVGIISSGYVSSPEWDIFLVSAVGVEPCFI